MCAPAIVNLYIQTKVDLFFITRGNIELWAIHSGQLSKILNVNWTEYIKSPSVRSSYIMGWRTTHGLRYIFSTYNCLHTSLGFLPAHIAQNNDTCFRNKHMLSERILQSASTHFSSPQASTSVWNNCRDQEVEFDWLHMFQQSQNIWNTLSSPISVNRSNFFFNLKFACEKFVFWKLVSHDSNSSNSRDYEENSKVDVSG